MSRFTIQSRRSGSRTGPAGWGCRTAEPTPLESLEDALEAIGGMPPGEYRVIAEVPYIASLYGIHVAWQGYPEDARAELVAEVIS